ncbi:hypothetical protein [Chelativorans sp. M5D2P16]|uniref:hypothetical protein n=1 Tax=Chelativorans sp. M5D2P16 TaxID=3095678 RepID=UPI002ACAE1BE|nr:hypothetical protein [Chelativorans sp. M5D2P16]MDZ5697830.1 hypothetical protein [Chelativorans sp. M5D2P16]
MEGNVTWELLSAFVAAVAAVVVAAFVIWWRIEGKVKEAKESAYRKTDEANTRADAAAALASTARQELAQYRTHVAETYVSKAGHRESTDQIMKAIGDIGQDMRGIRERLDNFIDNSRASGK